jgi:hypothetical protein
MDIERIERWVNLALRLEIHALILLAIGGALGIFRGRSN